MTLASLHPLGPEFMVAECAHGPGVVSRHAPGCVDLDPVRGMSAHCPCPGRPYIHAGVRPADTVPVPMYVAFPVARVAAVRTGTIPLIRSAHGAQNGIFCRVGYLLANARRSSAAQNCSAWSGRPGTATAIRRPPPAAGSAGPGPTRKRSGGLPGRRPDATPGASRCRPGSRSSRPASASTADAGPRVAAPSPIRRPRRKTPGNLAPCRPHAQQRGLAGTRLAPYHQHRAAPRRHVRDQLVQSPALLPAAPQRDPAPVSAAIPRSS